MAEIIIISGTNGSGKSNFGNSLNKKYNIPFIDTDVFYKNKFGGFREYSKDEILETSLELKNLRDNYFKSNKTFVLANYSKISLMLYSFTLKCFS